MFLMAFEFLNLTSNLILWSKFKVRSNFNLYKMNYCQIRDCMEKHAKINTHGAEFYILIGE